MERHSIGWAGTSRREGDQRRRPEKEVPASAHAGPRMPDSDLHCQLRSGLWEGLEGTCGVLESSLPAVWSGPEAEGPPGLSSCER